MTSTAAKLFNVSLHRNGTQSFYNFCRELGLAARHWPGHDFDRACAPALEMLDHEHSWREHVWALYRGLVAGATAFSDLPAPLIYPQAVRDWPNAKFMMIRRPAAEWVGSIRRHTGKRPLDVMEKLQYWSVCADRRPHVRDYSDQELAAAYQAHEQNVTAAMARHGAAFRIFDLADPAIGARISDYIGIAAGGVNFKDVDVNRRFYAKSNPPPPAGAMYEAAGVCPVCRGQVVFRSAQRDLRNGLRCPDCQSLPRERMLFQLLQTEFPDWRFMAIHEAGGLGGAASRKLARDCPGFVASQDDAALPRGASHPGRGYRSEDMAQQSFANGSFDLVISYGLLKHVFEPAQVCREIARTLRPGGAHLCLVPLVRGAEPTRRRASRNGGEIIHLLPAQWHGSVISPAGWLVTIDWGEDIAGFITEASGLAVTRLSVDRPDLGIPGEFNQVLLCRKPA